MLLAPINEHQPTVAVAFENVDGKSVFTLQTIECTNHYYYKDFQTQLLSTQCLSTEASLVHCMLTSAKLQYYPQNWPRVHGQLYWYGVYDLIIIMATADRHSTMTNMTSRLAINIRYLPDFDFSWSDCTPQCPRSALQTDNFLPTEVDAAIIKERSVQYIMRFLVENFPSLKNLGTFIPPKESLHPVARSEAIPMKILFKDEKYKSVTIEILSQLLSDADLSGTEQVC